MNINSAISRDISIPARTIMNNHMNNHIMNVSICRIRLNSIDQCKVR